MAFLVVLGIAAATLMGIPTAHAYPGDPPGANCESVPLGRTLEIAMGASGSGAAETRHQFIANVRNLTTAGQIHGV